MFHLILVLLKNMYPYTKRIQEISYIPQVKMVSFKYSEDKLLECP